MPQIFQQQMNHDSAGAMSCLNTPGGLAGLPERFYERLAKVTAVPWSMATSVDFLYPETEGERPNLIGRLANRYASRVDEAAARDAEVHHTFFKVIQLVEPPSALFAPRIAYKVLTHPRPNPSSSGEDIAAGRKSRSAGTT